MGMWTEQPGRDSALSWRIRGAMAEGSMTEEQVEHVLLPVLTMIWEGSLHTGNTAAERRGYTDMEHPKTQKAAVKTSGKGKRDGLAIEQIEKAMGGDRRALSALCAEIAKDVLFGAQRFLGGHGDAEDVAQNALIRICENLHHLKDPEKFDGWMYRIVLNESRRQLSKGQKHTGIVIRMDGYAGEVKEERAELLPHECFLQKEESRAMMELIDLLPDRQREAVLLHYYRGMSVTQTAEVMEVSHPMVSKHLRMAREKIKAGVLQRSRQAEVGMDMLALLPIGTVMAEALRMEGIQASMDSAAWAKEAATACVPYMEGNVGRRTPVSKSFRKGGILAGTIALCLILPLLVTWLLGSGKEAELSHRVLFSGGDGAYAHLNPLGAMVDTQGADVVLHALGWEITGTEEETVLYRGEGGDAQGLSDLPVGVYRITFSVKDERGRVYRPSCNFQIGPE